MLKKYCIFLIVFPLLLFSGEIEKEVSFSINDLSFSNQKGYDVVRLEGCAPTVNIGEPELALKPLLFVIPPNAIIRKVEVTTANRVLVGKFNILPAQYPDPISRHGLKPFVKPDQKVYSMTTEYPGDVALKTHVGTKAGYRLATISIYPLQYVPTTNELFLYSTIKFKVIYEEGQVPPEMIWEHQYQDQRDAVKRMVVNPEDVERWTPAIKEVNRFEMDDTTFVNPELAIMTADAYVSDLQPLREWECRKGVPTEIFTLTWISNNYPGANDTIKVQNFVQDYNQNHGTDYFLCVGDWGVFPMKKVVMSTSDDNVIPTDFWYADYDGDWYTEAYLGRFSVNSSSEVATYVNKALKYERESPASGFHEKIFMPGYVLWSGYGCPVNDTIALYDPPGWADCKRYDWIQTLTTAEISGSLNVGFGYTNISAHGDWDRWGGTYYHTIADADALVNAPPLTGIITAICCFIGKIDYASDCYVEHMMYNSHGGTAAFWGNTRYGYGRIENPGRSESQCIWFNDELTNNGVYNIAHTIANTNDRCVPYVGDDYVKHCMYTCCLYGNPQMELWRFFPKPMVGAHNSIVPTGPSTFTVTVTDSKAPIENARVCVRANLDPEYQVDYTNASGVVTFNIDPEIVDDTLWVTATKFEHRPYEGHAIVGTPGIGEQIDPSARIFKLYKPYPNPASNRIRITYSIPNQEKVTLEIYNTAGQLVELLEDCNKEAGLHQINWDGKVNGREIASGVYLLRLSAGRETAIQKVVFLKD